MKKQSKSIYKTLTRSICYWKFKYDGDNDLSLIEHLPSGIYINMRYGVFSFSLIKLFVGKNDFKDVLNLFYLIKLSAWLNRNEKKRLKISNNRDKEENINKIINSESQTERQNGEVSIFESCGKDKS